MATSIINPYAHGGGEFKVKALASPRVHRGAQWTGIADSKLWSVAFWVRVTTWTEFRYLMHMAAGGSGSINHCNLAASPNGFRAKAAGTSISTIWNVRTTNVFSLNTWYCVMWSCDLANSLSRMYVGDSNEANVLNLDNSENIDFTVSDTAFGCEVGDLARLSGDVGPVWFAPGQFVDWSVEAIRRRVFSANGKPVFAGSDGSLVTGVAPTGYFYIEENGSATDFLSNHGVGGDLVAYSTLGLASTSPSN